MHQGPRPAAGFLTHQAPHRGCQPGQADPATWRPQGEWHVDLQALKGSVHFQGPQPTPPRAPASAGRSPAASGWRRGRLWGCRRAKWCDHTLGHPYLPAQLCGQQSTPVLFSGDFFHYRKAFLKDDKLQGATQTRVNVTGRCRRSARQTETVIEAVAAGASAFAGRIQSTTVRLPVTGEHLPRVLTSPSDPWWRTSNQKNPRVRFQHAQRSPTV